MILLSLATKLGQGYVFTGVCDSVHRGGVCLSACWDTHTPGADTPGADTPQEQTPPWSRHPQEQTPPGQTHPQSRHPPERTPPIPQGML